MVDYNVGVEKILHNLKNLRRDFLYLVMLGKSGKAPKVFFRTFLRVMISLEFSFIGIILAIGLPYLPIRIVLPLKYDSFKISAVLFFKSVAVMRFFICCIS